MPTPDAPYGRCRGPPLLSTSKDQEETDKNYGNLAIARYLKTLQDSSSVGVVFVPTLLQW